MRFIHYAYIDLQVLQLVHILVVNHPGMKRTKSNYKSGERKPTIANFRTILTYCKCSIKLCHFVAIFSKIWKRFCNENFMILLLAI